MINLITSFFRPNQQQRVDELIKCLQENIKNDNIEKIHLFFEKQEDIDYLKNVLSNDNTNNDFKDTMEQLQFKLNRMENSIKLLEEQGINNKIQIILFNEQPLYSDFFEYANKLKGKICMISNSDIWLKNVDLDLIKLIQTKDKLMYALTRHESDGTCPLIDKYWMSHDSFIFKSPINYNIQGGMNHIQNKLGSENIIIIGLRKLGYRLFNPCKDIVIIHEHASGIRTYLTDDSKTQIFKINIEDIAYYHYYNNNKTKQECGFPRKPRAWFPPISKKSIFNIENKTLQKNEKQHQHLQRRATSFPIPSSRKFINNESFKKFKMMFH